MATEAKIVLSAKDETAGAFASAKRGLGQVGTAADSLIARVGGVGAAFSVLGGAIAGAVSVASLRGAVDVLDQLDDMAEKTGIATESLSALRYAGEVTGTPLEALAGGVKKLSVNMAAAAGGAKEQAAVFDTLGVKLKNLDGSLRGSDKVLADIANKFASFRDGPEKAALAIQVFGKSGADMIPLLNQGAAGMERLRAEAEKLGVVYGGDLAKSAADFNDNMRKLAFAAESFSVQVAGQVLPTMNTLAQVMLESRDGASSLAEVLGGTITTALQAFSVLVANVAFVLKGVGREIGAIAAQYVALWSLDFSGFNAISDAVKEDADRARKELDALEKRILGLATVTPVSGSDSVRERLAGRGGPQLAAPVVKNTDGAAKAVSDYERINKVIAERNDLMRQELAAGRALTEQEKFEGKALADLAAAKGKISAAQAQAIKEALAETKARSLALQVQHSEIEQAKQNALERQRLRNLDYVQSAAALRELDDERAQALRSVGDQIVALEDEAEAVRMSAQVNISLAEAVELVSIARLKEKQARFIEGSEGWEAVQKEIDKRKELAGLIAGKAQRELVADAAKEAKEEWKKTSDSINQSLTDALMRGFEDGKGFAENFRDTLKDMFNTLVLRPIISAVMNPVSQAINSVTGGISQYLGLASNASTVNTGMSLFNGGLTAPGGAYYNFATSGFGQSVGLSNAAPIVGNNVSAYAPAGTQLAGSEAISAIAPYAMLLAPIFAAWADGFFSGETRTGAQYGYSFDGTSVNNARRGTTIGANGVGATLLEGPDGGDPAAEASKLIVNSTVASINAAMTALGTGATLTAFQAAYETSNKGRGGVFAGGAFDTGVRFGETGTGDNYDQNGNPLTDLFESWVADASGRAVSSPMHNRTGTPEDLATDAAQAYLSAIQASVGLIPQIVKEQFTYQVSSGQGDSWDGSMATATGDQYVRVFDEAMRQSVKDLGLLPKRIADLIVDIDPEALSAEATAEIATKVQALITNVNGFDAAVSAYGSAVEYLADKTFDAKANIVEFSGGVEQFAANLGAYVDNFLTEEEKRTAVATRIRDTLLASGQDYSVDQILGATREQFRAGVEAFAAMGPEGERAYAALLSVAGAFASITAVTETIGGADTQGLLDDVNSAVEALARARRDEMEAITDQIAGLVSSAARFREFATDLRSFRDSLLLGDLSPLTPGEKLAEASRQFESVYADALSGDETAMGQLQSVAQEFLQASQMYNASGDAYLSDFARVQTALTLTATSADAQAVSAEAQVALLRTQLTALERLGGNIDNGALTVAAAIENLRAAVLAAQGAGLAVDPGVIEQAGLSPAPVAGDAYETQVRALYASAIGVANPDAAGLAFWTQRLQSGIGIDQLSKEMQESAKFVRGYATGGLASGWSMVGEKGPELVDFATPARVYSAQDTAGMFGSNEALLACIEGLRAEVAQLKEQVAAVGAAQIEAIAAASEHNAQRTGEVVGAAVNRGAFERKNAREAARV